VGGEQRHLDVKPAIAERPVHGSRRPCGPVLQAAVAVDGPIVISVDWCLDRYYRVSYPAAASSASRLDAPREATVEASRSERGPQAEESPT